MINFTYKWNLTDLEKVPKNGLKVFSCFSCGGGSTMGYKMSGFNVIGCNEIDSEMMQVYKQNHNPKYSYLESIETFKLRDDLPKELYDLDILDGSPPCSSFSMAGSREKKWGTKKKFREGQAKQVLDDLFFHYIDLASKLQPKVVIAENVKGMLMGNAKGYVKQIINLFNVAGYDVQLFLLNGATMGLPQRRERVFFVCRRKDLKFSPLKIGFKEETILFEDIKHSINGRKISPKMKRLWDWCKKNNRVCFGEASSHIYGKKSYFNHKFIARGAVCPTVTATCNLTHPNEPRYITKEEVLQVSSFPNDFRFKKDNQAIYQMGMSVPPLMMHKLSQQIKLQWFREYPHSIKGI